MLVTNMDTKGILLFIYITKPIIYVMFFHNCKYEKANQFLFDIKVGKTRMKKADYSLD